MFSFNQTIDFQGPASPPKSTKSKTHRKRDLEKRHDLSTICRDLGAIPRLTDGIKACEEAKEGESRIHVVTAFWYEFVIANAPNVIGLDLKGRKMTMLDDGKTQINMTSLPQAGRAIHSDIERGFIRAEIMRYSDLSELGDEQAVKAAGKLEQKGREYEVGDGDIIHFLFKV